MGIFSWFSSPLKAPEGNVRIVVLGGSYAGGTVAKDLAHKISKEKNPAWKNVSVRLVEQRDKLHHAMASPRAVVDTDVAEQSWIPYDKLFANLDEKQFIVSTGVEVTRITATSLETASGESIPYDYLVIATGSSNKSPMKLTGLSSEDGLALQKSVAEAIRKGESILLIGGGAVGIETAAEIKVQYPNKTVYLYESGQKLLGNQKPAISEKVSTEAKLRLEKLGVQVVLGERVDIPKDIWNDNTWVGLQNRTFSTSSGKQITSDVQLILTGNATYNSSALKAFDESAVDSTGQVVTTNTYQVVNHPNILALGDVAKTGASKQAAMIRDQAPAVTRNILSLIGTEGDYRRAHPEEQVTPEVRNKILSNATSLEKYDYSKASSMVVVTLGKGNGGLGDVGPLGAQTGWLGNKLLNTFKSDMMVANLWGELGYSKKDIPKYA